MKIGNRLSGWFALAVFATVGGTMVATDPAFAKVDVDKLTIGGEARIRYEYRVGATFGSNFALASTGTGGQANESAASHRIRVNVGYDLTPDVSFFAQIQDARVWGNEGCVFAPGAQATGCAGSGIGAVSSANNSGTGVDLHQGYIQVKNILIPGLSLKAGRQEIIFGDHRLFGHFGWSQIGNSFDAVRLTHSTTMADLDLFWARIVDNANNTAAAGAGAGGSTTGVIFPNQTKSTLVQDIYGAYLTLKPVKNWTVEPYFFLLQDGRDQSLAVAGGGIGGSVAAPQTRAQTRHTLGNRINGKAGGLDFTAENVMQFGSIASGTTPNARDLHINAHAHAVKTGFTFEAVPMKPRLGFEFNYASGDDCSSTNDGKTGACTALGGNGHRNTFDNLYPTNHFHYGYMDLMAWRNMVNYQIMFDVKPSPVSKFQVNFILHRLARTTDNWYRAGQVAYAVPTSINQAASLGQELNLHYWHTFKEKFKFEIGYGHFFTGEFIEKSNPNNLIAGGSEAGAIRSTLTFNNDSDQNWGYVMGSVLF